jgi:hypothetical protein
MTRAEFTEMVAELCEKHGGSVTSWIRTAKHNAKVGGKVTSRHRTGFGCDVVLDADEDGIAGNDAKAIALFQEDCIAHGLVGIDEGDHVHVQPLGPWGRVIP